MKSLGVLTSIFLFSSFAGAQIKLPGGNGIKIDLGSGLDQIFKPESPLTTSPKDIFAGFHSMDGWNPDFKELTNADKTDGKWILQPGAYRLKLHAFCGRGYAKGPSKGMGYGVAPWKGKQADILLKLVRNYDKSSVSQDDTQLLIWSILARVKPSKMSKTMQAELALLVEPKDIARLEGYSLDAMGDEVMNRLQGKVDESLRPFYEAENKFRGMMYQATQDYSEIEKFMVPVDENLPSSITQGRWIPHPNGYFFRYIPHGYKQFDYEVVVPRPPKVDKDAKGRITRIETSDGYISEVQYEDSVEPYKFPEEPHLLAYAIKKVRFQAPPEKEGEEPRKAEFDVQSCILQGTYSNKKREKEPQESLLELFPSLEPLQLSWFQRARDLYRTGRELHDDYNDARDWYDRGQRLRNDDPSYNELLETSHYRDGVREAIGGGGIGWIAETHARAAEALAAATRRINGLTSVDPTDGIGMPGNPGGQRAIMSNRSSE